MGEKQKKQRNEIGALVEFALAQSATSESKKKLSVFFLPSFSPPHLRLSTAKREKWPLSGNWRPSVGLSALLVAGNDTFSNKQVAALLA